jgi:hypothetical protein
MNRHMILGLAATTAAGLLAGAPQAARANVASVSIGPVDQTVSGLCPAEVKFTATITGAPGAVSYQFFGTGGAPDGKMLSTTIPASGSVTVSDDELVSSKGTFKRQVLAQQNNLVYSNQVVYTSNCSSLIINPGIFGGGSSGSTYGNHPANLHATNDANECGRQHNGSFACLGVTYNDLVLVWDYNPARTVCIAKIGGPPPKCSHADDLHIVDGYKLYRVSGGQFSLIKSQGPQSITAADVGKTSNGSCYAVTSYHGSAESSPSNTFCVGSGTPIGTTTTLPIMKWGYRFKSYSAADLPHYGNDVCGESDAGPGPCIGWFHHKDGPCNPLFCDHYNIFWRAYFRFDPAKIAGRNIGKATLLLHAIHGDGSCVKYVAAADRDWWDNRDFVGGDFHLVTGAINSKYLSLDVTKIVRAWARGEANDGFVLRGLYEDNGAEDDSHCQAQLDMKAALRIEQ